MESNALRGILQRIHMTFAQTTDPLSYEHGQESVAPSES